MGGLRKCWGGWAHLVLRGLLQVGSPATHTGSQPRGAVGRCSRGFSFSKAWHKEGLALFWEPGSISRSLLNPFYHLKPVPSPVSCDGFHSEDFPSETVFPVGQCPAACKLNCGRLVGKQALKPLLLSQLNSAQEQEAVITRIIILNCFEKTPTLVPKFYMFQ